MNKPVAWLLALAVMAHPALAQEAGAAPQILRGTIVTAAADRLDLAARDGSRVVVLLSPGVKVMEIVASQRSSVKSGSYVGTAAVREPDGKYRALELQVFPEPMRGVGLGTRPWNLTQKSSMTNGTVGSMSQTNGTVADIGGSGDMTLTVNDGSGMKTVLVPASVPVVTYAPGSIAELKPGAHVILFAQKTGAGALVSGYVQVGKDGLTPPM